MATISVDATPLEIQNLKVLMERVRLATENLTAGFTMFAAARNFPKADLVSVNDTQVSIKIPDE